MLRSLISGILLLALSVNASAEYIITDYYPSTRNLVGDLISGKTAITIDDNNKVVFVNEKIFSVTARVVMTDGSVRFITIPPRATGPVHTATGIIDSPISTISTYLTGGFGRSELTVDDINPQNIQFISYMAGKQGDIGVNIAYIASIIMNTAMEAIIEKAPAAKGPFNAAAKAIIKKISEKENLARITTQLGSGCTMYGSCVEFMVNEIMGEMTSLFENAVSNAVYMEILARSNIDPKAAADILLQNTPILRYLNILENIEDVGDIATLVSASVRFANRDVILFNQLVSYVRSDSNSNSSGLGSLDQTGNRCTLATCSDIPSTQTPTPPTTPLIWAGQLSGAKGNQSGANTMITFDGAISASSVVNNQPVTIIPNTASGISGTATAVSGEYIRSGYQYTAWGEWNGNITASYPGMPTVSGITHGHWVLGNPTQDSPSVRALGSATYTGQLRGDYVSNNGVLTPSIIGGTMNMNVNFSSMMLGANLNITKNGNAWVNTSVNNVQIQSMPYNGANYFGFNGLNNGPGGSISSVVGTFYGPQAQEAGGSWQYATGNGENASGVFRAKR